MLMLQKNVNIFLYHQAVDMRKAINGLSILVCDNINSSQMDGDIFIFHNKQRDKMKVLFWDRNGFVLYYKRLEKHKFKIPKNQMGEIKLNEQQLQWLLAGLDFMLMSEFDELDYSDFY